MSNIQKKYLLYGAASFGTLVKGILEECGIKIVGFIDQRAYEMTSYDGLPVWGIDSVPIEYMDGKTEIIISVKNVFEHEDIAHELYGRGWHFIIYKPYNVLLGYGNEKENRIGRIWDELVNGTFHMETVVPECQAGKGKEIHDFAYIREEENSIIVYIPAEFIFTNDYQESKAGKWGNVSVLAFFTHIDFFRFLNYDKTVNPEDYVQEFCVYIANQETNINITDAWKNNVVKNRTQIYEQMKDALDLDPDFFVRNAAEAEWNEQKQYFNLLSGKHRCTFQVAMGKKYLPLKISKEDYAKFYNKREIEAVNCALYDSNRKVTVPHPCFYRGMHICDNGEYQLLTWFARFYGRKTYFETGRVDFQKITILDYTNDCGNFTRFCIRLGCNVYRLAKPDFLEKQLNKLFQVTPEYSCNMAKEESKKIILLETDGMDIAGSLLSDSRNAWIVKYANWNVIEQFAKENHLYITEEISVVYRGGEKLFTCLMEGTDEEDSKSATANCR